MADSPLTLAGLAQSLRGAGVSTELRGDGGVTISSANQDSRAVSRGQLFLAWKGTATDAHDFVQEAVRRGAAAALVERFVDVVVPQLRVDDGRRAAAIAAQLLAGDPTRHLRVAAVTGTNGKTTTALLVRHLLSARWPSAAIGTLGVTGPDGSVRPCTDGLTTPGPVEIASALEELLAEGVLAVCLEASSHALDQHRLDGIRVDVAVFTNLTSDHLDYHRTRSAYLDAKARLLLLVRENGGVVVNANDPAWAGLPPVELRWVVSRLEGEAANGVPPFRGERLPDLVAEDVSLTGEGSRFRVRWGGDDVAVSLPLLGRFNIENALAAIGTALLMGESLGEAALRLVDAPQPRGRLEVTVREPVPVILDYAHTPDALERVLETLRPLYPGRLVLVFGAGGDRDRGKRPEMGHVAMRGADVVIVTSDNPRTEDPEAIIDEIGVEMEAATFERITDRRDAIARALELARPGDVVLLAGKGHETYQIIGTEKRPFDEREVVREILDSGRAA
ncbi:MAG: UDP-N-acetylmuramoyl-L-alanyl-D-glutamate--2,6-diaminopimelate ligase [Gemmatimonadetes bacterium]|nr:UDP-N-acetylmuramoyl-L-alanyl-D-glutamate--2,6-diaminopimelate ligase [Gemmatimonadota bacterium]